MSTNYFDDSGNFDFTNVADPTVPQIVLQVAIAIEISMER